MYKNASWKARCMRGKTAPRAAGALQHRQPRQMDAQTAEAPNIRCFRCLPKISRNRKAYGDCTEDTIVGCIAKEYAGKKEGMSVFDPVFVLSAILDWAGIAHNERGYLELTADYRTRAAGR